ncbi:MAG: DUF1501 domain-containing protein [Anaerolineae bacterium]|nr:DUF1501 domain-containing protein [Anaerolineae bacterium]
MTPTHCQEYARVSRRSFLQGGLASAAAFFFGHHLITLPAWMPRLALADPHIGPRGDTLVCIFLRGGADGLNIVVPHGDTGYYQKRPTINIPRPDDRQASLRAVDLDGFFGLHPALAPLHSLYRAGSMAFIQATGAPDESRSHFEAMDLMERGVEGSGIYTGWLARHLTSLDTGNHSALRAIGVGDMLPASLTGTVSATALQTIADYHLQGQGEQVGQMQTLLAALYNQGDDLLNAAAQQTFATIDLLSQINTARSPVRGRAYPENELGQGLQTVAQLIRAEVGVEVACLDVGGWDTHIAQGGSEGQMARLLDSLGSGLAAFYEDMQPQMNQVTVLVMSEFGRRLQENGSLGTDHGHGNMMMVLGDNVNGGRVYGDWPGLQPEQLTGPGDLVITTDYRDILGEIIRGRLNNPRLAEVFPGYQVNERGLVRG